MNDRKRQQAERLQMASSSANPRPSDDGDLLDIEQAARFLNVSETSLRRWTNAGRLACLRVGGRRERRFRRADLLAFIEEQPVLARAGHHLCGFYSSDLSRATFAADFLADGFEAGSVSHLVTASDARDQIVAQLERRRPSLPTDIEAGRLVLSEFPPRPTVQAIYAFWEAHFVAAAQAGARSLRAVGDGSGGPGLLPRQELVEAELRVDELARRFRVAWLCLYDVRQASGLDVLAVLNCHQDGFEHPVGRLFSNSPQIP